VDLPGRVYLLGSSDQGFEKGRRANVGREGIPVRLTVVAELLSGDSGPTSGSGALIDQIVRSESL
jgi:hypothetical protein